MRIGSGRDEEEKEKRIIHLSVQKRGILFSKHTGSLIERFLYCCSYRTRT
jgi:hypothetical protein